MTFGEAWGWGSSVAHTERIIDAYLDRGGNLIDTANVYTRGHSEKFLGDHVGRHSSRRGRAVLATKFFGNLFAGDPNGGGAGRTAILASCGEPLRRLQTDYIDLYRMRCWDKFTPIEETLRALDDLVTAGKVRYLGFSVRVCESKRRARSPGRSPSPFGGAGAGIRVPGGGVMLRSLVRLDEASRFSVGFASAGRARVDFARCERLSRGGVGGRSRGQPATRWSHSSAWVGARAGAMSGGSVG